jgi:hypothetical protein
VASLLVAAVPGGRAEHAKRSVRTAEQPDPGDDQGTDQENAGGGAKHPHQPPAVPCWVGEDRAGLMPSLVRPSLPAVGLSHEASLGELRSRNTNNWVVSVHQ